MTVSASRVKAEEGRDGGCLLDQETAMVPGPSKARRCWTGEDRSLGIGGSVVLFLAVAASAREASVTA